MTPLHERFALLLHPLADFYPVDGDGLPAINSLEPDDLPQPYRRLLVHERDMTSTLEAAFGSQLHIRVLQKRVEPESITRQVVLVTDEGHRVVEFGAIRIMLGAFVQDVRDEILACQRPLGRLLDEHAIRYVSCPSAYFSLRSDEIARHAFELDGEVMLYGRHNTLTAPSGEVLAEVVEILAPTDVSEGNASHG